MVPHSARRNLSRKAYCFANPASGECIAEEPGIKPEKAKLEDLGLTRRVTVDKKNPTTMGNANEPRPPLPRRTCIRPLIENHLRL